MGADTGGGGEEERGRPPPVKKYLEEGRPQVVLFIQGGS